MLKRFCVAFCFSLLFFGCAKKIGTPKYPDTVDGLKKFHQDLFSLIRAEDTDNVVILIKSLIIPNHGAWFKKVFGDYIGAKLAADYAVDLKGVDVALADVYLQILNDKQTDIRVTKYDKAGDPTETPLQKDAFLAMKNPVALFSVRFVRPGEEKGMHIWSFVYIDGSFRLAGKMKSFT